MQHTWNIYLWATCPCTDGAVPISGLYTLRRHRSTGIWILIINLIRSSDRLPFITGILTPIRRPPPLNKDPGVAGSKQRHQGIPQAICPWVVHMIGLYVIKTEIHFETIATFKDQTLHGSKQSWIFIWIEITCMHIEIMCNRTRILKLVRIVNWIYNLWSIYNIFAVITITITKLDKAMLSLYCRFLSRKCCIFYWNEYQVTGEKEASSFIRLSSYCSFSIDS